MDIVEKKVIRIKFVEFEKSVQWRILLLIFENLYFTVQISNILNFSVFYGIFQSSIVKTSNPQ